MSQYGRTRGEAKTSRAGEHTDPAYTGLLIRPQDGAILVLPNAWDAPSARVIEQAGARAIATTSAGMSSALGRPDGQGLVRNEMVEAVLEANALFLA
jgi:hypothetical protein